jgi:hypothetical protein
VDGACGDGSGGGEQHVDRGCEGGAGGFDGVLVDVAFAVLVAEPERHPHAADGDVVGGSVGATVVPYGLRTDDADVPGDVEEVVAVLDGVEAAGDDRDVPEVVDAIEDIAGHGPAEFDLPRAEGLEDFCDRHRLPPYAVDGFRQARDVLAA